MASKKKNISYILNKVVKGILSIANYIGTAFIQVVLWIAEVIWWIIKSLVMLIVALPSLFKKNKSNRTVFKKASSRSRTANPLLKPFADKDMRRKLLPGLVVVLLFLVGFAVYSLRQAQETEAHWWDETWLYRRAIQISNDNGEDLEDFQVAITLDTAALIAEGKMQATCDDLRITDGNGNLTPYWVQSNPGCDDENTLVWIKLPIIYDGEGNTTIYLYYGNASAETKSNNSWMPTGGTITELTDGLVHAFTEDDSFETQTNLMADVLVVAGGGGGGKRHGGGGGAGGLVYENNYSISIGNHTMTVGGGGAGAGPGSSPTSAENGENSEAFNLIAIGGGGGGSYNADGGGTSAENLAGSDGGSGGGGATNSGFGGSGTPNQGNDGGTPDTSSWPGAGGGGAGSAGEPNSGITGGSGGSGLYFGNIFGDSFGENGFFSGGGGGAAGGTSADNNGQGGVGGGADGSEGDLQGKDGQVNTGGGGGGVRSSSSVASITGGNGGSGIVLMKYPTEDTPSIETIATEEISPGPVAYWKFDEGTGTTAHDSSGQGNNGTLINSPTWQTEDMCVAGKCLKFDRASSNYISNTTGITLQNDFSYSAWVKTDESINAIRGIVSNHHHPNPCYGASLNLHGSRFRLYVGDGMDNRPNFTFGPNIEINQWYYVSVVYDSGTFHFYVNGTKTNETWTTTVAQNSTNFVIGRWAPSYGDYYFNGLIDEVKVYPYARTAEQIKDDYAAGIAGIGAAKGTTALFGSTKADFKPTDITGNVLWLDATAIFELNDNDLVEIWHDQSGSGNHATQSVTENQPAYKTNVVENKPAIKFNTNKVLSLPTEIIHDIPGASVFTVVKYESLGSSDKTVLYADRSGSGTGGPIVIRTNTNSKYNLGSRRRSGETFHNALSSNDATTNWGMQVGIFDYLNRSMMQFINGTLDGEVSTAWGDPDLNSTFTDTNRRFDLGARGTTLFLEGYIAEIIIYNTSLSEHDRQRVEGYLSHKWGLSEDLPIEHPYKNSHPQSAATRLRDPVAYWRFDEGYGTTTHDSVGNNHGSLSGTTLPEWINEGKIGKALAFDGDYTDWQDHHIHTNFSQITDYPFTITVWAKNHSPNDTRIAISLYRSATQYFSLGASSGKWTIQARNTSNRSTNSSVNATQDWTFLVAVFNSSTHRELYVNGAKEGEDSQEVPYTDPTSIYIGKQRPVAVDYGHGPLAWDGLIDEVKIYNVALSPEEILQDYNQGAAAVMGAMGTDDSGNPTQTASAEYCIPGDSSHCAPPVARWDFEEGSGTTTHDRSGNNNHGTLVNNPTWMTGKVGKALGFDGSDSYINSGIDESLQIQDEITISAWIKIKGDSGGSYSGIVSNTPASSQFNYLLGIKDQNDNPVASFQHSSVERLAHSQSLERNKWYFLTMVVDSSHIHLYVNGSNPESISKGSTNYTWNDTIIGTFRTNYFNGIIDQVRIYDYARTPAQIAWDYNRGAPVGHWKFDECQGTTAHDASGNENHGTINIGATGSQTSAGTCASGNSAHAWYNGREGRINSAMSFDGADDYVDLGVETFSYINNRNPVSVLAWVNTTNREQSFAGIFSKSQGGSTTAVRFDLHYYFAGEVLHLRQSIGDGSSTTSLARDINWVNNNEWHLVGMTWNGESMKLFLDGKQLGNSATINLDIGLSTASWKIGRAFNSSSYSFPGLIDDVRIYNYALTEYQIKLLHNEGAAVRFSNQFPFP